MWSDALCIVPYQSYPIDVAQRIPTVSVLCMFEAGCLPVNDSHTRFLCPFCGAVDERIVLYLS